MANSEFASREYIIKFDSFFVEVLFTSCVNNTSRIIVKSSSALNFNSQNFVYSFLIV